MLHCAKASLKCSCVGLVRDGIVREVEKKKSLASPNLLLRKRDDFLCRVSPPPTSPTFPTAWEKFSPSPSFARVRLHVHYLSTYVVLYIK